MTDISKMDETQLPPKEALRTRLNEVVVYESGDQPDSFPYKEISAKKFLKRLIAKI